MKLNSYENEMLSGIHGYPRQWAIEQQIKVGQFFGAQDFVEVSQAHIMCDTESLGPAGIEHLEYLASHSPQHRKVAIDAVTDPRGMDLQRYVELGQSERLAARERRTTRALASMGILMTDTCINYQSVSPPVFGEHIAFGDTGSTIYANSVFGARSNFEGGPAGLSAALTGRVPRYGYHLDEHRMPTHAFWLDFRPMSLAEWGALGAYIGKQTRSYWNTPLIMNIDKSPTSDELKHFGAALASYGSAPLFHINNITPESMKLSMADLPCASKPIEVKRSHIEQLFAPTDQTVAVDIVVFAAPQLSMFEISDIVELLDGRPLHGNTQLMVATSPEIKSACDRFGLTKKLQSSGAILLSGVCFYQMYARELAQVNGWKTLVSNSAKLVNIISGYGYQPFLATTKQCIKSALTGRL